MLASELIARALRLINVPGRGSSLSPEDQTAGLEALQEVVDAESVSKQFVPGIRRHFCPMQQGKAIYSYGAGAGIDLRSDDFDDDPAPIKIEAKPYIREGSFIVNNEQVDNYRLEAVGTWLTTGGAAIQNNRATLSGISTLSQSLGLTAGVTYRLKISIDVNVGDLVMQVQENAVDILNLTLSSSGLFEFDFLFSTTLPTITFTTNDALDSIDVFLVSIVEQGKERLELPDSMGSDYGITLVDQTRYNRRFTKGTGGRPYNILYTRSFNQGEIRFDNSAITGDILVMDVLVNRLQVTALGSQIRMNPSGIKWLRYAIADHVSGEFGKSLNQRQITIMKEAWDSLASGNRRRNKLGVDRALRERPTFDVNRGDP